MHFLDPEARWPIVVVSLTWLAFGMHSLFGAAIARAAHSVNKRVAFIASGDCSHRLTPTAPAGYSPRAHEFDQTLVELIGSGDFEGLAQLDPDFVEAAGECGLRSFITLGGFVTSFDVVTRTEVLAYEGPWGVGYLTAIVSDDGVGESSSEVPDRDPSAADPDHERGATR